MKLIFVHCNLGSSMRIIVWLASLSLNVGFIEAVSADEPNHQPLNSSERATVRPLAEIIKLISEQFGGHLLAVDLEREIIKGASVVIYEAKILTSDGHVMKLAYDAKTLELLRVKGADHHHSKPHGDGHYGDRK